MSWSDLIDRLFRPYILEGQYTEHCLPLPPDPEALPYDPNDNPSDSSLLLPYEHPFDIPKRRKDVNKVYGNCGAVELDRRWRKQNMVVVKGLPGIWNKGRGRMYCHKKVAPAFREALRRCEVYGVLDYFYRIGCFRYRHIQNNSRMPLSYHSWGAAFDVNIQDNRLKRYKRGNAPKPWSDEWWEVWPKGVPELVVRAFTEAGFTWGGYWQTVPDPQHFQLVG